MTITTDTNEHLRIPLRLRGVTSTICVTTPTHEECQTLPRTNLTNQDLTWDPHNEDFSTQENKFLNHFGEFNPPGDQQGKRSAKRQILSAAALNSLQEAVHMNGCSDATLNSVEFILNDKCFLEMIITNRTLMSTETSKRTSSLKPEHLASKWNISIGQAEDTIKVTTQQAVRHIANPALSRRFKTNVRLLRYNRLPHTVFTDTMISTVKSTRERVQACADHFARVADSRTNLTRHIVQKSSCWGTLVLDEYLDPAYKKYIS